LTVEALPEVSDLDDVRIFWLSLDAVLSGLTVGTRGRGRSPKHTNARRGKVTMHVNLSY